MTSRIPGRAAALLVTAAVLWSASTYAAKIALGSGGHSPGRFSPFTLACVRFAIGGGLLALVALVRRRTLRVERIDVVRVVGLAVFGIATTYSVFYAGIRFTTATEGTLIFAAEPLMIAVLAALLLREKLGAPRAAGLAIGFIGVYLIVERGLAPSFSGTASANSVVLASLALEAFAAIIGKGLTRKYDGLTVVTLEMLVGAALLVPFALREGLSVGFALPYADAIAAMLFLATVCSALCYGIWYSQLSRFDVSAMAGFLLVQPLMGPVYGYVLLHERPGPWTWAGAALVVAGVWIVSTTGASGRPDAPVLRAEIGV